MDQEEKKGINPLMIGGIVAVLAIGGIIYMMSGNQGSTTTQETEITAPEESMEIEETTLPGESGGSAAADDSDSMMEAESVQVIEVEAGSFYYKPNEIRVKKGDKVKIVMTSVSMMHDFVIDELGVQLPVVKDGDVGEVEFIVSEVGEFEYYCSVGEHRAKGQIGKLIVE